MRAGCQVGTKADELLQGAPRVPPSEVLPLPDTPDTPTLYIMQLERQFPSSENLDGCLQLRVFLSASMIFFSFIIFAICALMICCIFLVHP